jgi:hypothetical protein
MPLGLSFAEMVAAQATLALFRRLPARVVFAVEQQGIASGPQTLGRRLSKSNEHFSVI